MTKSPTPPLRIACLEPSATAICLELGLGECIVGVTHECGPIWDHYIKSKGGQTNDEFPLKEPLVLTRCGLNEAKSSQAEIYLTIQKTAACSVRSTETNAVSVNDLQSTYPLIPDKMQMAKPTVIFTQDLCDVCAPTKADVMKCLWKNNENRNSEDDSSTVSVVSLQPTTLLEVTDTFVTIADACGVPERGQQLKDDFIRRLKELQQTIQANRDDSFGHPTMFILEWLDPVFDSGHWTYQMMEYACVHSARPKKDTHKALVIDWKEVYKADPDVIVVGCCGFDLERNVRDTLSKRKELRKLRAGKNHRIYASNGDWYIAQPAPFLLQGVALLAQCAYQNQPRVLDAIAALGYETIGWQTVDVMKSDDYSSFDDPNSKPSVRDIVIGDMEDIVPDRDTPGFAKLHEMACERGERTYVDPETGYAVFTRIAHEERGKCCGSGCRHCPYSHVNVKDKATRIQQPSILYQQTNAGCDEPMLFSTNHNKHTKILFFSGGKDSFLAIRALVRSYYNDGPFGLILMTTFDATSRMIAHQEVRVDQVIKQATHLNITLVGIPLRRASGETYTERIQNGLDVIRSFLPSENKISSLVFGDLHLSHVKEWRDKILSQLDCRLEYPLWKKTYSDLLVDLETSRVPCKVSGSTREKEVPVGTIFDRNLYERLVSSEIDGFGECGEFHSLAMVWDVPRSIALGIPSMTK